MTAGRRPIDPDDKLAFSLAARASTVRKFRDLCTAKHWHHGEKLDEILTEFMEGVYGDR